MRSCCAILSFFLLGVCCAEEKPKPIVEVIHFGAPAELESKPERPIAEIVPLPPEKKETPKAKLPEPQKLPLEPGFGAVLSGTLEGDLELTPKISPVLIRGTLVVPAQITLKIAAGTVVRFKPALTPMSLWVLGKLSIDGVTGNPVELINDEKDEATLALYGTSSTAISGARLKGLAVAHNNGIVEWSNCEILNAKHYALASGVALISHCSFKGCGGIFATYNAGPWALFARRNLFDGCREGFVLGSDPGESCLNIEKNNFVRTKGAYVRAMPQKSKATDIEFLIGENWYGTALPEDIDMRIIDRRLDRSIRARINTRPPSDQPFAHVGAGVSESVLAATQKEQVPLLQKLLKAYEKKLQKIPTASTTIKK